MQVRWWLGHDLAVEPRQRGRKLVDEDVIGIASAPSASVHQPPSRAMGLSGIRGEPPGRGLVGAMHRLC
jgi:hypothetical protein